MTSPVTSGNPTKSLSSIRSDISELIQYVQSVGIQNFSHQSKEALASFFESAASRISELSDQLPIQTPTIPDGATMLWQISGGNPQAFVSYLRTVPDPALNALITQPDILNNMIEYLERQFPPGEPAQQYGMQHADLQSSNVWGYKYDPRNKRLIVRFNDGSDYGYDNVPRAIFDIFRHGAVPAKTEGKNQWGTWWKGKMPSLGAAFYQMIRLGNYPYQKLS